METIEKTEVGVETPEQEVEETKIETEIDSSETIEDCIVKWYKSISEKPIKDVLKSIGNIKLKYFIYLAAVPFALYFGFWILYFFIKYVIIWLLWDTLVYGFSMASGANVDYEDIYRFFDSDLYRTIPLCFIISIIVTAWTNFKNDFLIVSFYFVFLVASLECWNYLHINSYIKEIWGVTYFAIFFVIIPLLIAIKDDKN
jgi:hypothetical protein